MKDARVWLGVILVQIAGLPATGEAVSMVTVAVFGAVIPTGNTEGRRTEELGGLSANDTVEH